MAQSDDQSRPAPRADVNVPGRALMIGPVGSFPPGPHPDGLLGVDDDILLWFWDAVAGQWRRTVRN